MTKGELERLVHDYYKASKYMNRTFIVTVFINLVLLLIFIALK